MAIMQATYLLFRIITKCSKDEPPFEIKQKLTQLTRVSPTRNSTKPNQYFFPFLILYKLNVHLNLEVQGLGTPSLMT